MKILQINAVYGVGSTGRIIQDIHTLALQRGIDSYVAYSSAPMPENEIKNGYRIGRTWEKKAHALLCRIGGKQAYFSHCATKKLIKYIKEIKPDIVHLHNLHSNFLHLNMLLAFLAKEDIKTIVTLHDCWFFTGGCFHYTFAKCDKWLKNCGNCPKKKLDTPAYVYDASSKILKDRKKYFSAIPQLFLIGTSNWIAEEAKKRVFSERESFHIPNGLDTEYFKPTVSDFRSRYDIEDKFVVLGTANKWLAPINRETLETVASGIGEDGVLVIFGCDKEAQDNLPKNVVTIGYTRDLDELRKLYSMADVFANCTREDTLPFVNMEAQACGTPVVTYCNTGAKETVDNASSFSVESGNADAMLEKILFIKAQGKQTYSEQCREFIVENFNKEKNYEKYMQLYSSI